MFQRFRFGWPHWLSIANPGLGEVSENSTVVNVDTDLEAPKSLAVHTFDIVFLSFKSVRNDDPSVRDDDLHLGMVSGMGWTGVFNLAHFVCDGSTELEE